MMIMSCSELDLKVYPKTVYTDLVGLPDPVLLGLTIHYYNHSDQTLYMKIFISGPSPWSPNAVQLGSLGSGSSAYVNLDNFTSRTKPSQETTEELTLTLRGYNDSGYSELKYEFSRSLTVVFIKSDDGSWTTNINNNFDDGTVQGWTWFNNTGGGTPTFSVATDYVLSPPYSLKWLSVDSYWGGSWGFRKLITTPNKDNIFAVINVRLGSAVGDIMFGRLRIIQDSSILIHLGINENVAGITQDYVPEGKWLRIVVPLPKNSTFNLDIAIECYVTYGTHRYVAWLDDFKIISK